MTTEVWKFVVFALVTALGCAALRRQSAELAALLAIVGCVGLLAGAMAFLSPVMQFFTRMQVLSGLRAAVVAPVIKTAAVGLLSQMAEGFCRDAGEVALAKAVEIGGGILGLYALLPLAESVAELLEKMVR